MATDAIRTSIRTMPESQNGGFFHGQPGWTHPDRVIDSFELLLVKRGSFIFQEGETKYYLEPGTLFLVKPGVRHKGVGTSSETVEFYWFHFTLPQGFTAGDTKLGKYDVLLPTIVRLPEPARVEDLFIQLLHAQEVGCYTPYVLDVVLGRLLLEITEQSLRKNDMKEDTKVAILAMKVMGWMDSHLNLPVTIENAADELGYNHDYLARVFKAFTGSSFMEHLFELRVSKAKSLLRTTTLKVKEIAHQVGFKSSKHFSRVFSAQEGLSPSEFRKLYYAKHENYE